MTSALQLGASTTNVLSFSQGITLLSLVVGGSLIAGIIVIVGRAKVNSGSNGQPVSIIRSWIAITLVLALVVFCAGAFLIDDANLRSTLFGGLIASVGAAVAFYFSSKNADQARADILNTAVTISQGGTKPSAFTASSPPSGQVNVPYSTYRFAATGLPAPTYTVGTGSIPAGLTLDPDGTLHGTPTSADSSTFTIAASNTAGGLVSQPISINIAPA